MDRRDGSKKIRDSRAVADQLSEGCCEWSASRDTFQRKEQTLLAALHQDERRALTTRQRLAQLVRRADRSTVHLLNDVARANAGVGGRSFRLHLAHAQSRRIRFYHEA